jgi:hypothetical protein
MCVASRSDSIPLALTSPALPLGALMMLNSARAASAADNVEEDEKEVAELNQHRRARCAGVRRERFSSSSSHRARNQHRAEICVSRRENSSKLDTEEERRAGYSARRWRSVQRVLLGPIEGRECPATGSSPPRLLASASHGKSSSPFVTSTSMFRRCVVNLRADADVATGKVEANIDEYNTIMKRLWRWSQSERRKISRTTHHHTLLCATSAALESLPSGVESRAPRGSSALTVTDEASPVGDSSTR